MYGYPYRTVHHIFNPPISLTPYLERLVGRRVNPHFHIPLYTHKCGYCNLFSRQSCDEGCISAYLRMMYRQTEQLSVAAQDLKFTSFVIGEGTPLILNEKQLNGLFYIVELFNVRPLEALTSIETPPEYADKKILQQLWAREVERPSVGIQSFNGAELKKPKRKPMLAAAIDTSQNIRGADFPQLSLDLIYSVEGQTVDSFTHPLTTVPTYHPDELFIYPLYVRPGTRIDVRSTNDMYYTIYRSARELLVKQKFMQTPMRRFIRRKTVGLEFFCGDGAMLSCGFGEWSCLRDLHYATPYTVRQEVIAGEISRYVRTTDSLTVTDGYLLFVGEVQIKFIMRNLMYYRRLDTTERERRSDKGPDRTLSQGFIGQGWIEEKNQVLLFTEERITYPNYIGRSFVSSVVRRLMSRYIYL